SLALCLCLSLSPSPPGSYPGRPLRYHCTRTALLSLGHRRFSLVQGARARATFPSVRLARTMTPTPYTTQPPINVVRLMDDGSPPPPSPTPTTPCQPPDA
ncbi:uncharacterized protein CLUP02_12931, partial [Colletotrichum lupini]